MNTSLIIVCKSISQEILIVIGFISKLVVQLMVTQTNDVRITALKAMKIVRNLVDRRNPADMSSCIPTLLAVTAPVSKSKVMVPMSGSKCSKG